MGDNCEWCGRGLEEVQPTRLDPSFVLRAFGLDCGHTYLGQFCCIEHLKFHLVNLESTIKEGRSFGRRIFTSVNEFMQHFFPDDYNNQMAEAIRAFPETYGKWIAKQLLEKIRKQIEGGEEDEQEEK